MIQAIQFRPGEAEDCQVVVDAIRRRVAEEDAPLWIVGTAPTLAELDRLQQELQLPPLQREALTHRVDRPRVEQFGGMQVSAW